MPLNKKDQLAFDETIYTQPVSNNAVSATPEPKPAKPKIKLKTQPTAPASLQAFLPGLSRRGRPRSKNPIPATVRATESRKRRIEAGTKRIELLVAPEIAADIDLLSSHFRVSRVEIISRLVAKAAKRIRATTTD
jgi:hypothetical protein